MRKSMAGTGVGVNDKNNDGGVGFVAGLAAEIACLHWFFMDELVFGRRRSNLDGCHEGTS
jgi:hypothetical protein